MKEHWSLLALKDLARLYDFLARHDATAASRAVTLITNKTDLLDAFPELGPVDENKPAYRTMFIIFGSSSYALRYRIRRNGQPAILRVFHCRERRK